MREDTVVELRQPGPFSEDPLTEILRVGARRFLAQAVEMEVTAFVEMHADLTDEVGRGPKIQWTFGPAERPAADRTPRVFAGARDPDRRPDKRDS